MINQDDILRIGAFTRTHGKQGELQCRTDNTYWDEAEATFIVVEVDAIPVPFRVTDWRSKGADLLFTLQGVDTEEKALRLVGCPVSMLRKDIAAEDDAILSWQDLVGYTVNGCTIEEIDESTANVLAVLQDGRLVPLHEDLITAVDHTAKTITMTLPEGL
ncbi:MAG: hypothetical protein MJZ65_00275 [Paludibacteraceae bacterium]|nr:hypothetical protein [Paludibacteraceae bacterium]